MAADLVFVNGPVFTADPARSFARAVAVSGGRILAVGSEVEIRDHVGAGTEVVDLDGRLLTPGFQDSHVHTSSSGLDMLRCDLTGCTDAESAADHIARYAAANPDLSWIVGSGWHQTWFPRGCPSKDVLDGLVPDRPAFIYNADGHGAWVNSRAIELAGIRAGTPDPHDGRIERLVDGEPQGTLHEGAASRVERLAPAVTIDDMVRGILAGQGYLLSKGITAWQDTHIDDLVHAAYRALADGDRLKGTAVGALWWEHDQGLEQIERFEEMREERTGRYRPLTVKLMVDGVVENFTAWMLEPYLDGAGVATENRGIPFIESGEMAEAVAALDARGFSCHFHAIGDAAVRAALDAVEVARSRNGWTGCRHVICHIQVVHPADIPRFRTLGVVASAQALWAADGDDQEDLTKPFLGKERSEWQYPFGSLLRAGATLAMGSDWAVSTADVLDQIDVAVTRLNPDNGTARPPLNASERITLLDGLAGFTAGSSYANHLDHDSGSIAVGRVADLAVLDRDPFQGGPIRDANVAMTIVGGEVVFEEG